MIKSYLVRTLLVFVLGFVHNVAAEGMTKNQYLTQSNVIVSEYQQALQLCEKFNWNDNEVCLAQAEGKLLTDNAELFATYKPSAKSDSLVKKAYAESRYAITLIKCNGLELDARKACWDLALEVKERDVK